MKRYLVKATIEVESQSDDFDDQDAWIAALTLHGLKLPLSQERYKELSVEIVKVSDSGIVEV